MNVSSVSGSVYSPPVRQLQTPKTATPTPPAVAAPPDQDRDGDTDKFNRPDTNDRRVGTLLDAKA